MNLVHVAKEYIKKGVCPIPTDSFKRPTVEWYEYQKKIMYDEEVETNFKEAKGIAVLMGAISGNAEAIDVDCKYDLTGRLWEEYKSQIPKDLFDKLLIQATINNGYHIIYRCEEIGTNKKLAQRECNEEERKLNKDDKIRVLVETRAEAGYICIVPTQGYKIISENKKLNQITIEERNLLMDIAGSFNQVWDEQDAYEKFTTEKENKYFVSPFEDYSKRQSAISILQSHGWTIAYNKGNKTRLKRPGAKSATSAEYNEETNRLKVFSTSSEFDSTKSYSSAEIYCILEANSDWKHCYQKLIRLGFGQAIDKSSAIKKQITNLKTMNMPQLLKDKFPEGEIKGDSFWYENKEYKI